MPIAIPCPKDCLFDWVDFHKKLDTAMAHLISETSLSAPAEEYQPSKVSLIRFVEYSNAKKLLQEKGLYAKDSQKP